jgi:hypothetical protein
MKIISNNIKWIMLISGVLTCTMIFAAIAPQSAMLMSFGDTLNSPIGNMIARSWGFLIFLLGLMLIYGAYKPAVRPLVLTVAGTSKLFFVALVIAYGYGMAALISIVFDGLMALTYFAYLLTSRND